MDNNKINIILILEDIMFVEELKSFFTQDSFTVKTFTDGKIAYKYLLSNRNENSIVILNNQLPSITGFEIISKLQKKQKKYAYIFLTKDILIEQAIDSISIETISYLTQNSTLSKNLLPKVFEIYQFAKKESKQVQLITNQRNKLEASLSILRSYSDYIFITNLKGYYTEVQFPDVKNVITIDANSIVNKHITEIVFNETFTMRLNKAIDILRYSEQAQEFDFSIDIANEKKYLTTKVSYFKDSKNTNAGFLIITKDISKYSTSINQLRKKTLELETRLTEQEKDIDFYIKQGDVTTNQRAKIQKERDSLAIEKIDMLKKKKIMEEDLNLIMKQGDKIAEQKYKMKIQRDLVTEQKMKITNSIIYAKRIQSAVLPPNRFIQHLLSDNFILYKPKDIVSGDYYWIKQNNDKTVIAAADCTGHGVPGALMSMLGITFLNEIVNKKPNLAANEILNELRTHIISSLRQTGMIGESRDGMDIALCIIDKKNKIIEYAGANNPLYLIRNNELLVFKADRMPIGMHRKAKSSFTNHIIDIKKDDRIYIFSDGYIDQFGGEEGRKFLAKNFKKLLLNIHKKTFSEQKQILINQFETWKGSRKQIDDILVIGFKISFHEIFKKSQNDYNWENKVILIVEDDESNYMLLEKALKKSKATIIHAENGKEAVNIIKSDEKIDVILMDIRMPVMDGIEATQLIKQYNSAIPIIIQTSFTMSSEKEKGFKAGCDDYVTKPINMKELFATID
ncbi:MAG: response regulator, partial [Bacteroidales bacterium]|nr:response regulator [Bacteroidales bacterium]